MPVQSINWLHALTLANQELLNLTRTSRLLDDILLDCQGPVLDIANGLCDHADILDGKASSALNLRILLA